MSPPMMLNSVDLPQPDGPMIDTNSPGATENETSSTAVTGPSRVAKRLVTRSTSSSLARADPLAPALTAKARAGPRSTARRDLDQLGELFFRERRRGELEIN